MNEAGVEEMDIGVIRSDEQWNFRAAENDPFGSSFDKLTDDPQVLFLRFIQDLSAAKFVIYDPVDEPAVLIAGNQDFHTELFR